MTRLGASLVALFVVAGCAASDPSSEDVGTAEEASVCATGAIVKGVDISHYQANTDWGSVATSRGFAIAKATEGETYTDPDFASNWQGMKDAGLVRGAYQFFHPGDDPVAQADFFTNTVGPLGDGDLPDTLDLEITDGLSGSEIAANALTFLARVESNSGKTPIVYTSPGFFDGLSGTAGFEHYTLWVANWQVTCPTVPLPWTGWTFWQDADDGTVAGVSGTVDTDQFNGAESDLVAFAGTPAPPLAQVNGNDGLTLVNWASDAHAELFVKAPNGDVSHTYTAGANDTWSAPAVLDGGATCGFGSVMWPAPYSYAEVLAPLSPDGDVAHLWWTSSSGWNTFKDLGGAGLQHVSTITWPDTHAELFALGPDGSIWHDPFDFASVDWAGWTSLGGVSFVTGAGVIEWTDGHVELFATDAQGAAWHSWSGSGADFPNGWHAWASLGGSLASRPVPVRWADDHVEVFARGTDGHLWSAPWANGDWQPFAVVDATTTIDGEPGAGMNFDGGGGVAGPEIVARRTDGAVVHLWWDGTAYSAFTPLLTQSAGGDPFFWTRLDKTAEVFVVDPHGNLTHTARDTSGTWAAWAPIASGPFDPCAAPSEGSGGGSSTGTSTGTHAGTGTSTGSGHPAGATTGSGPNASGAGGGDADASDGPGSCSCRAAGDDRAPIPLPLLALAPAFALLLRARRRRGR
ncbi:MAG TPA: GH25 family lysozyme [Byssovorax sp.]|jgi:lysozyme